MCLEVHDRAAELHRESEAIAAHIADGGKCWFDVTPQQNDAADLPTITDEDLRCEICNHMDAFSDCNCFHDRHKGGENV